MDNPSSSETSTVTLVELVMVEHNVGLGVESDPVRRVIELHDLTGRLIVRWDTLFEDDRTVHNLPRREGS